jgi:hypothetical protein
MLFFSGFIGVSMRSFSQKLRLKTPDGRTIEGRLTTPMVNTSTLDGPEFISGIPSARLDDGTELVFVDAETYQNFQTGEILKLVK